MGCTYAINPDTLSLDIEITGFYTQFLALKRSFSIPLSHVQTAVVSKPQVNLVRSIQLGTLSPSVCAGTFWLFHGFFNFEKKIFVFKRQTERTIMFNLMNDDFEKIIIQVPDGVDVEEEAAYMSSLIKKLTEH